MVFASPGEVAAALTERMKSRGGAVQEGVIVADNKDAVIGGLSDMATTYPWTFALGLFATSIVLYSQAATTQALVHGALHAQGWEHERPDEAEAHEEEGDDGGREDFEEALDPQVHHPPAPVLDHGEVRVAAPHQAGTVEQADRGRSQQEKRQHHAAVTSAIRGWI